MKSNKPLWIACALNQSESTYQIWEGHVHTCTFSCENGYFSVRLRLPSTRKRLFSVFESLRFHRKRRLSRTGLKVETFENGDFRKRCVVVWTGENRDFWKRCWFENIRVDVVSELPDVSRLYTGYKISGNWKRFLEDARKSTWFTVIVNSNGTPIA